MASPLQQAADAAFIALAQRAKLQAESGTLSPSDTASLCAAVGGLYHAVRPNPIRSADFTDRVDSVATVYSFDGGEDIDTPHTREVMLVVDGLVVPKLNWGWDSLNRRLTLLDYLITEGQTAEFYYHLL